MQKRGTDLSQPQRPPRTVGLSLAIAAAVILFTILPLLQASMVVVVQLRLNQAAAALQNRPDGTAPIAVGGDFLGVSSQALLVQVTGGLLFLIIAIFAWRGRPPVVRWVLMGAVLLLLAMTLVITWLPTLAAPNLAQGIDSAREVTQALNCARLPLTLLIPLYTLWYMNRGPARAFYRGYYLTPPPVPEPNSVQA